jgi:hypothetical protein
MYPKQTEQGHHSDNLLALIPAMLLAVLAVSHLWRSQHQPISSWRQGGMGMYADINDLKGRIIRVYVKRDKWESVKVSERYETRLDRTRLEPTQERLVALSAFLACDPLFLSENPNASHVKVAYFEQQFEQTAFTVRLKEGFKNTYAVCQ